MDGLSHFLMVSRSLVRHFYGLYGFTLSGSRKILICILSSKQSYPVPSPPYSLSWKCLCATFSTMNRHLWAQQNWDGEVVPTESYRHSKAEQMFVKRKEGYVLRSRSYIFLSSQYWNIWITEIFSSLLRLRSFLPSVEWMSLLSTLDTGVFSSYRYDIYGFRVKTFMISQRKKNYATLRFSCSNKGWYSSSTMALWSTNPF